ncbi:MAG: hypothetical protein ACYCVZ_05805 [Streptosporangiaceae bacterium]
MDLLGIYDRPDAAIAAEITERVIAGDFVLDPREFTVGVSGGVVTIAGRVNGTRSRSACSRRSGR